MVSRLSMRLALPLLALLAAMLLAALPVSQGAHAFDAYRLVQYDRGTSELGSRRTVVNHQAVTPTAEESSTVLAEAEWVVDEEESAATKADVQDLSRKVLVVRIAQLSPAKLRSTLSRGAAAVLIVLPRDLTALSAEEIARYQQVEQYLANNSWDAAIYFAFDDEYLGGMVSNLESSLDATDRYHLQVTSADATTFAGAAGTNFHGWQHAAASATADSDSLPTVAIVASYDSLGAVPGLAFGADQSGSGAIALLEVARIFHQLYADFRTQASVNLLFVLTGLDRVNFASTRNWLRNIDSRVLESIDFALCIDRIGTATTDAAAAPLFMHVSKLAKTPELQSLYGRFTSTASELGVPLEIVHRKINVSSSAVYWQHEQFSRKRIVAATLSSSRDPLSTFEGASIFDAPIDLVVLERNIRFVVEAVAKHIYDLKSTAQAGVEAKPISVIGEGGVQVNSRIVAAYASLFSSRPRVTGLLSAADAKAHPAVRAIDAAFDRFTIDAKKQPFSLDQLTVGASASQSFKLYQSAAGGVDATNPRFGVVEMRAFQVKPFAFDLYVSGAIAAYLLAVYIACKQPSNVGDVIAILIGR